MKLSVNLPTTTNTNVSGGNSYDVFGVTTLATLRDNLPARYLGVTPDQISGLTMWLDASFGAYNGSSVLASDGDAVANWQNKNNPSGAASASQGNAVNRPTFRNVGGVKYMHFDSTSHPQNLQITSMTGLRSDAATVFVVVRAKVTTQQEYVLALGVSGSQVALQSSGSGSNYLLSSPTGGQCPTQPITGGFDIVGFYADSSITPSTTKGAFMFEGANTNFQLINGANAVFTSYDASTSYIGATSALTSTWDGDYQAILIFNRILTAAEILQIRQYLYTTYIGADLPSQTVTVKQVGDSISAGYGTTQGTYLSGFQNAYSNVAKTNILNYSVPGQTTDTSVSTGVFASCLAAPTTGTVLGSIFFGANDLNAAGNLAHFKANITSMCASYRASGVTKIVVATVLDRNDAGVAASFRTDAAAFNTWLRSNYTTFADILVDYAADSRLGASGAADSSTWFQDKVHPTNAGQALMATIWRAAVFPIIADRLVFTTQPNGGLAGNVFGTQPVIAAQDAFGNTDTTVNGSVTISKLSGPTGIMSGTLTKTMTSGVATFTDIAVNAQGSWVFHVVNGSLSGNSAVVYVPRLLIGSSTIQPTLDNVATGTVVGWRFVAAASGTSVAAWLATYSTLPTSVAVGIYSDASSHPGTLLGSGNFTGMTTGWNTTPLVGVSLTAGTAYWLVVTPTGSRINIYNQYPSGTTPQEGNSGTALPSTWSATTSTPNVAPTSIYITG